jgi:hypothetical protein
MKNLATLRGTLQRERHFFIGSKSADILEQLCMLFHFVDFFCCQNVLPIIFIKDL